MEFSEFINMLLLVLLVVHVYGMLMAKSSNFYIPAKTLHGCFLFELIVVFCLAIISKCVFFVWPEFAFFFLALFFMCVNYRSLRKNTVQKEKTYDMLVTHVDKNEHIVFGEIFERCALIPHAKLSYRITCAAFGFENFDEVLEGKELPVKFSDFNISPVDKRYDIEVEITDEDV